MAIAAYASLVSLTHVLDNVHYRAELRRLRVDIKQIEALQGRVNFLLEFVEVHSERTGAGVEDIWRQISEVAFEAEEIFDFHVVSQLQLGDEGDGGDLGFSAFGEDIEGLIQKIDFIKNELLPLEQVLEGLRIREKPRVLEPTGGSSATSSGGKNTIVGFDEPVIEIMEVLTRDESNLQILPIVGMGGIGKTTLAKKVFDDPYIIEHFDLRIWLTISQEYNVHEILKGLLNNMEVGHSGENLGEALHKKLFGRKYLIVMDDVWTMEAWNDLSMFFPNNQKKSRIMLTTRLENMVGSLNSHNSYSMTFLDEDKSWNLFCQTIFGQVGCPYPELEEIGRQIVKGCKGLPLEIIVIGGMLANSNMRKEHWELVAKNLTSFAKSCDGEHCLNILRLSYNDLPIYLKPCFLYMRTFREDAQIDVSELINLWIDEGFIKVKRDKSLEEIAEEYVKDLVGRNLILFSHTWLDFEERKTCGIHDLLRDLCFIEADKQHFRHSSRVQHITEVLPGLEVRCFFCNQQKDATDLRAPAPVFSSTSQDNILYVCCPCMMTYSRHSSRVQYITEVLPGLEVRRFLCNQQKDMTDLRAPAPVFSSTSQDNVLYVCCPCMMTYSHLDGLRLMRVLTGNTFALYPPVQHTKLRHVSSMNFCDIVFLSMVHWLWNLQTLVIERYFLNGEVTILPFEIWKMPQLRHIKVNDVDFPDPPVENIEGGDFFILKNLQTLSRVRNFKCTKELSYRISNLKELKISYSRNIEQLNTSLCNLDQLEKLESLSIQSYGAENFAFPNSLKKLFLSDCTIPWIRISMVGSLPNLEVLELNAATVGFEWNPIEGEFVRLKRLHIAHVDLEKWTAEQVHFPNLEWLSLESVQELEEIPLGIGDIETLHTLELLHCCESVITSANKIYEDQQSMGNITLKVQVFD